MMSLHEFGAWPTATHHATFACCPVNRAPLHAASWPGICSAFGLGSTARGPHGSWLGTTRRGTTGKHLTFASYLRGRQGEGCDRRERGPGQAVVLSRTAMAG